MKYWVYIDRKVIGPYEPQELARIQGFSPDTKVCPVQPKGSANPAWKNAVSIQEIADSLAHPQPKEPSFRDQKRDTIPVSVESINNILKNPETKEPQQDPLGEDISPEQAIDLIKEVMVSVQDSGLKAKPRPKVAAIIAPDLAEEEEPEPASKKKSKIVPIFIATFVGAGLLAWFFMPFLNRQLPIPTKQPPLVPNTTTPTNPPVNATPKPEPNAQTEAPSEPDLSSQALELVKEHPIPEEDMTLQEKLESLFPQSSSASSWKVEKEGKKRYRVSWVVKGEPAYIFMVSPISQKIRPISEEAKKLLSPQSVRPEVKKTPRNRKKRERSRKATPKMESSEAPSETKKPAPESIPLELPKLDPQPQPSNGGDGGMNLDQLIGGK